MNKRRCFNLGSMLVLVLFCGAVASYATEADDDALESAIKNSYTFRTYLKEDAVQVDAKDGVVRLTGTVPDEYHKILAADTAANLPGVSRVDDQLKIAVPAPAEYSDEWLSVKVKAALLFNFRLSPFTKVYVKDGVVTLKGEADSLVQKDLTTEYIKDVEGVKDVKNKMAVAAGVVQPRMSLGEKIDDASITAQAKLALLFHRSTSGFKTRVSTQKGVVTVSGIAATAAQKDLVTKLVSNIKGVDRVVNEMTVE